MCLERDFSWNLWSALFNVDDNWYRLQCKFYSRELRYLGTKQTTPLFMLHLPVTGSGSEMMMKGGSSRKLTLIENFSGTPWGGTWLLSGQTMSLISSPVSVLQLPTWGFLNITHNIRGISLSLLSMTYSTIKLKFNFKFASHSWATKVTEEKRNLILSRAETK